MIEMVGNVRGDQDGRRNRKYVRRNRNGRRFRSTGYVCKLTIWSGTPVYTSWLSESYLSHARHFEKRFICEEYSMAAMLDHRFLPTLGHIQYIVWSTRSCDVDKLCQSKAKKIFFIQHAKNTELFFQNIHES